MLVNRFFNFFSSSLFSCVSYAVYPIRWNARRRISFSLCRLDANIVGSNTKSNKRWNLSAKLRNFDFENGKFWTEIKTEKLVRRYEFWSEKKQYGRIISVLKFYGVVYPNIHLPSIPKEREPVNWIVGCGGTNRKNVYIVLILDVNE